MLSFALHYYYFYFLFHPIPPYSLPSYPYLSISDSLRHLGSLCLRPSGRLSALMNRAFHALSASSSTHLHATPSDLRFYCHRSGPWPLLVKCALGIHPPTQVYLWYPTSSSHVSSHHILPLIAYISSASPFFLFNKSLQNSSTLSPLQHSSTFIRPLLPRHTHPTPIPYSVFSAFLHSCKLPSFQQIFTSYSPLLQPQHLFVIACPRLLCMILFASWLTPLPLRFPLSAYLPLLKPLISSIPYIPILVMLYCTQRDHFFRVCLHFSCMYPIPCV